MRRLFALALLGLPACLLLTTPEDPWACTSDADCRDGQRCRSRVQRSWATCVNEDECGMDEHCRDFGGVWARCEGGLCRRPGCVADRDCAPYACKNHWQCTDTCTWAGDCAPGHSCVEHACAPTPCKDTTACDGGRCLDGFCTTDCDASGCASGFECSEGRCRCQGTVCGAHACDANGLCRTPCDADWHCRKGFSCFGGKCLHCNGTPLPCEKQPSCTLPGCALVDRCGGGAIVCDGLSPFYCGLVKGCTWSGGKCTGGTLTCGDVAPDSCAKFDWAGCALTKACAGTPTVSCRAQTPATCAEVRGCANDDKPDP